MQNNLFLDAFLKKEQKVPPIWLMRQAGRYMPEYRAVRNRFANFLDLCKKPDIAAEITMQPIYKFGFDAAIIFSDILTVPDAMGLKLKFEENVGPIFENPIKEVKDIEKLDESSIGELFYVFDAIKETKKLLQDKVPLIGFAGSPWTIATYMIEGGSSKSFSKINKWRYKNPVALHYLLEKISKMTVNYLNLQIESGVDAVQIFDTWGGILPEQAYYDFSLAYMEKIVAGLLKNHDGKKIPNIVFTKNGGLYLSKIASIGCDAIGLDQFTNLKAAKEEVGDKVTLQGNLEPSALYADFPVLKEKIHEILDTMRNHRGFIFNLGHGILPDIECEKVQFLIDTVRQYR